MLSVISLSFSSEEEDDDDDEEEDEDDEDVYKHETDILLNSCDCSHVET